MDKQTNEIMDYVSDELKDLRNLLSEYIIDKTVIAFIQSKIDTLLNDLCDLQKNDNKWPFIMAHRGYSKL